MSTRPINWDKIITLIGSACLLGLVLSAWLPQPCPLLRNKLVGCPRPPAPTPAQKEEARIPHMDVPTQFATFTTKAQEPRNKTIVNFSYKGALDQEVIYLQAKVGNGGYRNLALVNHPLLVQLSWPSISNEEYQLYQKNPTYDSVDSFLKNLPPAATVAADSAVADQLGLKPGQYTLIDDLTDLGKISYILTSYTRPLPDGSWLQFHHPFDLSGLPADAKGELEWALYLPNQAAISQPFQIGTVHVDYSQARATPK